MGIELNRRQVLAGTAATSLVGSVAAGQNAEAQGRARARASRCGLTVTNLDPAQRIGATDGNIIRCVFTSV